MPFMSQRARGKVGTRSKFKCEISGKTNPPEDARESARDIVRKNLPKHAPINVRRLSWKNARENVRWGPRENAPENPRENVGENKQGTFLTAEASASKGHDNSEEG